LLVMSAWLFLMTTLTSASSLTQLMEYGAVMGLGLGITFPVVVLAVQYSVSRRQIGTASSLAQFTRNLGGTIGLSVLGALQINAFGSQLSSVLKSVPAQFQSQAAVFLRDPNTVGQVLATPSAFAAVVKANPQVAVFVPALRAAFALSVTPLFWAGFAFAVCSVFAGLLIGGSFKQQVLAREALHEAEEREALESAGVPPMIG
jgi:hypothetical protein